VNPLYTATSTATGDGRNGHTQTEDGVLSVDVRIPKEASDVDDAQPDAFLGCR